jgi:hypothetical protein
VAHAFLAWYSFRSSSPGTFKEARHGQENALADQSLRSRLKPEPNEGGQEESSKEKVLKEEGFQEEGQGRASDPTASALRSETVKIGGGAPRNDASLVARYTPR